jgi:transposase
MSSSIADSNSSGDPVSDPVVVVVDPAPRPVRRTFTAGYRARVVAEYEAAPHGQKSAVLRREGLYQSQVAEWSSAREAVTRAGATPRRAHRATSGSVAPARESDRLRAENQRLTRELAKSQAVVEIMSKLQGLLEAISESTGTPSSPTPR